MSWITTSDLTNVTGSGLSSTILQAVIDDGEREVTAYLKARGITASACDACKTASLKLAKAGLLEYWVESGKGVANAGEFITGADGTSAWNMPQMIRMLREQAYKVLDDYLAVQSSLNSPRRTYMVKVN